MPSITITSEQHAALARGEDITVKSEVTALHNVVLFVKATKASIYVWDGAVLPNGRIAAARFQWLTDTFGNPCHESVVSLDSRWLTNAHEVHIVRVGA